MLVGCIDVAILHFLLLRNRFGWCDRRCSRWSCRCCRRATAFQALTHKRLALIAFLVTCLCVAVFHFLLLWRERLRRRGAGGEHGAGKKQGKSESGGCCKFHGDLLWGDTAH